MRSHKTERREIIEAISLAHVVSRLSVLLRAGVSLTTAWREVAMTCEPDVAPRVERISELLHSGERHRMAVSQWSGPQSDAWKALGAIVAAADEAGTPMSDALWELSNSLREEAAMRRRLLALAEGPRLTTWVLAGLPLLGLLMAEVLGVGAFAFLMGTTFGMVLLLIALVAIAGAMVWMRSMVIRAFPPGDSGALARELLVVASGGGCSPEVAVKRVVRLLEEHGCDPSADGLVGLTQLSRRAGIPISRLARAEAKWARVEREMLVADHAARLSVTILIPLGVLVLPAFVVVSVVPVAMSLLGTAVGSTPVPW